MDLNRRQAVLSMLFGGGLIGLRSLATGIPAAALLNPRKAFAAGEAGAPAVTNPQFLIYSTSWTGDPSSCNVPGTYDDPNIAHPNDPSMAPTPISLGGTTVNGAQIWSTLPPAMLAQTCFFHHSTYTIVHGDEAKVLRMMGAVAGGEMLPSVISRELQAPLGTVRAQPISLSGVFPEALFYKGASQPLLTPTTLASVLASPKNGLGAMNLERLRDQGLSDMNAYARSLGNPAQQAFIDEYATSVTQLRTLQSELLGSLAQLKDNSPDSQIQAALILFQMKVTPVVTVHIPFGGDNHNDPGLAREVSDHQAGTATLSNMFTNIAAAGLQGKVTFALTNVFGRTMIAAGGANAMGRNHNNNHHCSILSGPAIRGSVIGGLAQPAAGKEYKALPIDSATGKGTPSGDVPYEQTFGAMGQTLCAAVGLPSATITQNILTGTVIRSALV